MATSTATGDKGTCVPPLEPDSDDKVILMTGDKRIRASKKSLCRVSGYFQAMFSEQNDFMEKNSAEISLKNVSSKLLQILVDFSENNGIWHLGVDLDNSVALLSAACMLQFEDVIHILRKYLLENLSVENSLEVMVVAETCGLPKLHNKAKARSLCCFEDVVKTDVFLDTPVEIVQDFLSSSLINVSSELSVFEALEKWTTFDESSRTEHLDKLIPCIRTDFLTSEEIAELLKKDFVVRNKKLLHLFTEVKNSNKERSTPVSKLQPPRKVPEVTVIVGGNTLTDEETYSRSDVSMLQDGGFVALTELPEAVRDRPWGMKACSCGENLYVVGGKKDSGEMQGDWNNGIWRYDSMTDTWSELTRMPRPRRHHSVIATRTFLVIVGGFGKHRILQDTVDRYDLVHDTWESLPRLNQAAVSPAVCSMNDDLYVFKYSLEVLTCGASKWLEISVRGFPFEIGIHTAIPVGETDIYLMGFYSDKLIKVNIENADATEVGHFKEDVGYGCLVGNKIWAVLSEFKNNVESYDLILGKFEVVCTLPYCCRDHSVLKLVKYPLFMKP